MNKVQPTQSSENLFNFLQNAGDSLETLLVEEPGKREIQGGVKSLQTKAVKGNLWKSVKRILSDEVKNVLILVGSTSSVIMWPPTDTDGPGGAFALGYTLIEMGKNVVIVTDTINHDQIFPALEKSQLWLHRQEQKGKVEYFSLNPANKQDNEDMLEDFFKNTDHIINVGRPGPDANGVYWSYDARQMTNYQPDFPLLFQMAEKSKGQEKEVWTTVIGELGNELGMGEVKTSVGISVPEGNRIACPIKADYTIVSTVVNWGAWAMSSLLTLGFISKTESERYSPLQKFLPSKQDQETILNTLVEEQSRCGVTMTRDNIIDNFSAEENWEFLEKLSGATRSFNVDLGKFFEKAFFSKTQGGEVPKKTEKMIISA